MNKQWNKIANIKRVKMLTTYMFMISAQLHENQIRRGRRKRREKKKKKKRKRKRKYESEVCALSDFQIIFPAATCEEIIFMRCDLVLLGKRSRYFFFLHFKRSQ